MNRARTLARQIAKLTRRRVGGVPPMLFHEGSGEDLETAYIQHLAKHGAKEEDLPAPVLVVILPQFSNTLEPTPYKPAGKSSLHAGG